MTYYDTNETPANMYRVPRFVMCFIALILASNAYANSLKTIFALDEMCFLYSICDKVRFERSDVHDKIRELGQFLYHNDRDSQDCFQILCVCKALSEGPRLNPSDEKQCIRCIKCAVCYLLINRSVIVSLYKDRLNDSEIDFLEKLDTNSLIRQITAIEQEEANKRTVVCAIL